MSTEDTTARLREQIAEIVHDVYVWGSTRLSAGAVADAILPIVLAQVEAAKAAARRDALLDAADDAEKVRYPLDGGSVAEWLRARASVQGATAQPSWPAGLSDLAQINAEVECEHCNGFREVENGVECCDCDTFFADESLRPGGQGAQSSGHEVHCCLSGHPDAPRYLPEPCTTRCTCVQRVPGQPGEQDTAGELFADVCQIPDCYCDGRTHP